MRSVQPPRTMPVQFPTQHSQSGLRSSPVRIPVQQPRSAPFTHPQCSTVCSGAALPASRSPPPPPLLHPVHSVLLPLNPPQQPRDPRQPLCPSPRATAPLANPRHITILLPAHRTAPLPRRNRAHRSRTAQSAHQHRCFSASQLVRRQPRCRLASAPLPPHTPFTGRLDPLSRPTPITDTIRTRIGSGWLLSACIW